MKYFASTIVLIVAAAIVAGFFIVGSPKTARLLEQDYQRISALQLIQSEILNFWMNKSKLPKTLTDLKDDIRGISIPKDPVTGEEYAYKVTGAESFQLCATFAMPTNPAAPSATGKPLPPVYYSEPYSQENWQHSEGNVCFDRKIDKDIYKPVKR